MGEQIFLALFDGDCERAELRLMAQALADAPSELNHLVMVMQGGCSFDSRARAYLAELMRGLDGQILSWSVVAEGPGFWASACRSVMANIHMVAQSSTPFTTAASLQEVGGWLAKHGRHAPTCRLQEFTDRLRRSLHPADLLVAN